MKFPSWAEVEGVLSDLYDVAGGTSETVSDGQWDSACDAASDMLAMLSRLPTTEPGENALYCTLCRTYLCEHWCDKEPAPSTEKGGGEA